MKEASSAHMRLKSADLFRSIHKIARYGIPLLVFAVSAYLSTPTIARAQESDPGNNPVPADVIDACNDHGIIVTNRSVMTRNDNLRLQSDEYVDPRDWFGEDWQPGAWDPDGGRFKDKTLKRNDGVIYVFGKGTNTITDQKLRVWCEGLGGGLGDSLPVDSTANAVVGGASTNMPTNGAPKPTSTGATVGSGANPPPNGETPNGPDIPGIVAALVVLGGALWGMRVIHIERALNNLSKIPSKILNHYIENWLEIDDAESRESGQPGGAWRRLFHYLIHSSDNEMERGKDRVGRKKDDTGD